MLIIFILILNLFLEKLISLICRHCRHCGHGKRSKNLSVQKWKCASEYLKSEFKICQVSQILNFPFEQFFLKGFKDSLDIIQILTTFQIENIKFCIGVLFVLYFEFEPLGGMNPRTGIPQRLAECHFCNLGITVQCIIVQMCNVFIIVL